jgi:hypothetical protein
MDVGGDSTPDGHASAAFDEGLLWHSALCPYLFACSLGSRFSAGPFHVLTFEPMSLSRCEIDAPKCATMSRIDAKRAVWNCPSNLFAG